MEMYKVLAGLFANKTEAEQLAKKLNGQNKYHSQVILLPSGAYTVYVLYTASKDIAEQTRQYIKDNYSINNIGIKITEIYPKSSSESVQNDLVIK